jgi:hypothetical protein
MWGAVSPTQIHYRARAKTVASESIATVRSTWGRPGGAGSRLGPPALVPTPGALDMGAGRCETHPETLSRARGQCHPKVLSMFAVCRVARAGQVLDEAPLPWDPPQGCWIWALVRPSPRHYHARARTLGPKSIVNARSTPGHPGGGLDGRSPRLTHLATEASPFFFPESLNPSGVGSTRLLAGVTPSWLTRLCERGHGFRSHRSTLSSSR